MLELQRKHGLVSYLKKQRTLALIGKLVQERVKESFPELKVFEMRPEEIGKEEGSLQQRIAVLRPWMGGKQGRKSTGRLASDDRERWLLDQCILRAGTFMLKSARNQSWGAGAGIIG